MIDMGDLTTLQAQKCCNGHCALMVSLQGMYGKNFNFFIACYYSGSRSTTVQDPV